MRTRRPAGSPCDTPACPGKTTKGRRCNACYMERYRARSKALRRCERCGGPRTGRSRSLCADCRAVRSRQALDRARQMRALGFCAGCGGPATHPFSRCLACRLRDRTWRLDRLGRLDEAR